MNIMRLINWLSFTASRAGGDILAIQTFRNAIMSASVLASATLVAFMGVLAIASKLHSMAAVVLSLILAASASTSILSIVTFARLGFTPHNDSAILEQTAKQLLLGLRLIQTSAVLLISALILAALLVA
jgi:hypothetical protein